VGESGFNNCDSLLLNIMKKILGSVGVLALVGALVLGATGAFFSDTETSTGNTFTAGAIDLTIDSTASYNGQTVSGSTWELKDLVPASDKFFNFADIKPGDEGENTISVHVLNNDAWVCAEVSNLTNADNTQTEPESLVDANALTTGELQQTMNWKVWKDDGVGTDPVGKCDNVWQEGEQVLAEGHPTNGVLPLFDSNTGAGPLKGDSVSCLGVAWSLPAESGNETQTDSMTGDIGFTVVQSRNNDRFVCGQSQEPEMGTINLENKNSDWQVMNDDTFGTINYSVNDSTFHGTVVGQGLVPSAYYQITLNGPGSCTATDDNLATFGANLFQSGYWNNWAPSLSPTCVGNPGEGLYNMNLVNNDYTVQADGSGNINYPFNLDLPNGNYTGVKVLVKKILWPFVSPWTDPATVHTTNLFETASINFTVN